MVGGPGECTLKFIKCSRRKYGSSHGVGRRLVGDGWRRPRSLRDRCSRPIKEELRSLGTHRAHDIAQSPQGNVLVVDNDFHKAILARH